MKKRVSIVLSLCLAVLLLLGIGGYAYVADYYRADEIAVAAAVHKSARVCHLHGENLPQHRRLSATSPAPLPPKSSAGNPTDRARRY